MGHTRDRLERSDSDFYDNKIELPRIIAIRIWDKIKVWRLMSREPLILHAGNWMPALHIL